MKIAVAVLFGGKSVEHEISVISAVQAMGYLDKEKYDLVPVYITKEGRMYTGEKLTQIEYYKNIKTLLADCRRVVMTNLEGRCVLLPYPMKLGWKKKIVNIDVAMPIVHGTNVEDGALQGFLKTLDVPFTGCDVLSSAVGMDKHVMKLVFQDADTALHFAQLALRCGRIYSGEEDRYAMETLALLLKKSVAKGILTEDDLYTTEELVIRKLEDSDLKEAWHWFCGLCKITEGSPEDGLNINAKRRYIDPLILDQGRVSEVYDSFRKEAEQFVNESYDKWLKGISV